MTAQQVRGEADLVDLHSHVLPALDDGARDIEEALAMLRIAAADGITTIVATPHAGAPRVDARSIRHGVTRLNAAAAAESLPIRVMPGSEVALRPDIADRYAAGELVTLNDTAHLLVELPLVGEWPPNLSQVLVDLLSAGAMPLLAHAERYPSVQRDPRRLVELADAGVRIQINAGSLSTRVTPVRRTAETLLRHRLAHLIASDAHDARRRPPCIAWALARAGEIAGPDYAEWMARSARAVLAGDDFTVPVPEDYREPRRWRHWLRRLRA